MARQMEMTLRGFSQGTDDCRKKKTRVVGQSSAQPVVPYYGSGSYSGGTDQQAVQRSHRIHRKGRRNRRSSRGFRPGQGFSGSGQSSGFSSTSSGASTCRMCGRSHQGPCLTSSGACFRCGEMGHMARECPRYFGRPAFPQGSSASATRPAFPATPEHFQDGSQFVGQQGRSFGGRSSGGRSGGRVQGRASGSQQSGRGQARVFTLTPQDARASNAVVSGDS
eukprot:XP_015582180.1 hornerin-like [Ricinus communis]